LNKDMHCTKSFRITIVAGCKCEEGRERYGTMMSFSWTVIFLVVDCLYVMVLNV
jgi:hypothetical protein